MVEGNAIGEQRAKLLERVDEKVRQEGVYRSRTELINALLRKFVGLE